MSSPAPLRIIFLGSPEFALPSLSALAAAPFVRLVAVITQPDKPAGRGRLLTATPVTEYARQHGLPLLQPARLRAPELVEQLRDLRPDLLVTVAYGRIVPNELLDLPARGAINVHPSLLPAYRGASPIQRAVQDGRTETGITVLYQTAELDAGDIILQEPVTIGPDETAGELEARLAEASAPLLVEAVRLIAAGQAPRRPQPAEGVTLAPKLTKEEGRIAWDRPAAELGSHVRAMDPWPSAYTLRQGAVLKVWRTRAEPLEPAEAERAEPGKVLAVDKDGILVAASDGALRLLEVQPEGGRRMTADAYARGHRVKVGERWG